MLEMNDNAVKSGIAHQDIGASAENEFWNTTTLNELIQQLQIFKVFGANQKARRTANTIGGPVVEWLVFENVALNLGTQCLNSQAAWQLDHSVEGLREDTEERFHDNRTGLEPSEVFQGPKAKAGRERTAHE